MPTSRLGRIVDLYSRYSPRTKLRMTCSSPISFPSRVSTFQYALPGYSDAHFPSPDKGTQQYRPVLYPYAVRLSTQSRGHLAGFLLQTSACPVDP